MIRMTLWFFSTRIHSLCSAPNRGPHLTGLQQVEAEQVAALDLLGGGAAVTA